MNATNRVQRTMSQYPDQWWTFSKLMVELRNHVTGPDIQKALNNLVLSGSLDRLENSDAVAYKIREPQPSREPSGKELEDWCLQRRAELGLLGSADMAKLRREIQRAQAEERREEYELLARLEELAQQPNPPQLTYEDILRLVRGQQDENEDDEEEDA
jgi:hypothetical protein